MSQIALSGNAGGTGTLTIAAPNTNTDRTLTLPDNTGTIITTASTNNYPTGGPAFSAYQSVAQSIPITTNTKLSFQSEEFDTANCFDSTTNYRFTPNVAGYYHINGYGQINGMTGAYVVMIYKNGGQYKKGSYSTVSQASPGSFVSSVVYFNGSTDYVELWVYSGAALSMNAGSTAVYFNGCLLRAA